MTDILGVILIYISGNIILGVILFQVTIYVLSHFPPLLRHCRKAQLWFPWCRFQNLGEMMVLGRYDAAVSPSFIKGLTLEGIPGHTGCRLPCRA
ncbi:hypothetical protein ACS0TY_033578 [Phlomoides rotata]